jgi:hypothetical protein
MKQQFTKLFLILLLGTLITSDLFAGCPVTIISNDGSTSGNARIPSTRYRRTVGVYLITPAEMAATGLAPSQIISAIGWNYQTGSAVAGSGTLLIYMQNTTDATNTKGTSWATNIAPMTLVHNATTALPTVAGDFDIPYTGGSPFTYTGTGLYIAFDWCYSVGTLSTTAVAACNTTTSPATTIVGNQNVTAGCLALNPNAASAFRPATRVTAAGFANDAKVDIIYTLGSMPNTFTTNHIMQARIINVGNNTLTNLPVTLNISGANTFTNTQSIASLAPCSSAVVTFAGFTPTATGTNTVAVNVPADDNTSNDTKSMTQPVTANLYSYKYTAPLTGGVGFNAGIFGVFVSKFNTAIPAQINEIKVDFQLSTASRQFRLAIYNDVGGQPDLAGPIYTSPSVITITSAAQQAFIPITPTVSVNGNFYVGVIQETTNTVNIGFSYQTENPSRSQTFFYANNLAGGPWIDFGLNALPFRSAIEVQLYIPQPPNCALLNAPADLSTACINGTTLTWASGGGGPTGYRLTFGNNGPSYDNILNNSDLGNVTSYPTGPLAAGTYGWKIVAYNVDGDASGCSTRTFTTNLASCYCQPTYGTGTGSGDYISLVQIPGTTLNNPSVGAVAPYYTLYPQAGSTTATLGAGLPYTMNVAGGTFTECYVRGWIDYNQDGTFSASESIGISPNCGALTTTPFNFTVSGSALAGTTRMRLRSSDTAPGPADLESCGNTNSAFGETEDYDITIYIPVACSATPTPGTTNSTSNPVCSGSSFTLSLATTYSESGISYVWESSPNGTSWTPVPGGTNATLVTTQTAATWYHCIVSCTGNGSGNSSDLQVTMNPFYNCYCVPSHFGCGNGDITNVTFNTLNNTTGCTGLAYASFPASGSTTTSVDKGQAYNLSITTNQPCSTSVWIDFNHNGIFESSEWTMVSSSSVTNVPTVISIPIPVSALPGQTGMRIRSRLATFQNDAGDACLAMGSGEGEDYVITINCAGAASANFAVCNGSNINLTSGPTGATFSWTGPNSFVSGLQNPTINNSVLGTHDGLYSVTVTSPGCSENLGTTVTINPLPTVAPTASGPFCEGTANLSLNANASGNAPFNYSWSGPGALNNTGIATPSVPNAPASASGTYSVLVTDANGCTKSSNVLATVWALPNVLITPIGSTNLCSGQTTTDLQAGGAAGYVWSTSETTSLITVSTQGNYTVTGTDGNGCINTDVQAITETTAPNAPIVTPVGPITLCTDGFTTTSVTLSVTNYSSDLLWTTGETTQSILVDYSDAFNVTYTDINGCYAVSNTVSTSVDMYSTAPTGATSNAVANSVCLGNSVTLNVTGGTLGDNASWKWYEGGCGTGASIGTGPSITITPATLGSHNYFVRSESVSCGNTSCSSISISVINNPPLSGASITTYPATGCYGTSAIMSGPSVANATYYNWSCAQGGVLFNGNPGPYQTLTPSVTVTFNGLPPAGASGFSVCMFAGNACGQTAAFCRFVRGRVSEPSAITGNIIGCPSTNGSYSIPAVAGADSYTWIVTGNATINGGGTSLTTASTSITVNFLGTWTSGSLSVVASLNCGFNSAARSMTFSNTPAQPGAMTGPGNVCPLGSSSFSVPAVTGAASYTWTCSVPGAIITPSSNSCSIQFPAVIPGGSSVCVSATSACGSASAQRCKGIANGTPTTPSTISGPVSGQCGQLGVSYSILPVSGATSYLWTANNGASVSGPSNLSAVSINFPSTFTTCTLTVAAINSCGTGPARTLVVNGAAAMPSPVSGNQSVCNGGTESYTTGGSTGATSYGWTVPAGATILNTPPYTASILVLWGPTGGNVSVNAINDCGISATRTYAVAVTCREAQQLNSDGSFSLYPNPTTGKVKLSFNASSNEIAKVQVTDLMGRNVHSFDFTVVQGMNEYEADLSTLAKGVYMLHFSSGEINQVVKITVE